MKVGDKVMHLTINICCMLVSTHNATTGVELTCIMMKCFVSQD